MFSFHSHSFSSALFRFRSDVMHDMKSDLRSICDCWQITACICSRSELCRGLVTCLLRVGSNHFWHLNWIVFFLLNRPSLFLASGWLFWNAGCLVLDWCKIISKVDRCWQLLVISSYLYVIHYSLWSCFHHDIQFGWISSSAEMFLTWVTVT